MDTALNINDTNLVDAIWEQLKPLQLEIRKVLASRLAESLKSKPIPSNTAKARKFVESLSVSGGEEVPNDERGIGALLEEKSNFR